MEPTAQSVARTYSDRVYTDPWEKVLDYRRVQQYTAKHPNAGRAEIGNAFELPPGRVRAWINDGMPDPVRGVQTVLDYGWIDPDPTSDIARALVELLAHVLAGGSINANYSPRLSSDSRIDLKELQQAFTSVGVDTTIQHADIEERATEVVAADDGSVLGRCLVAMGAAHGSKTDLETVPNVVDEVPVDVRASFARIYARHRAVSYEQKDTTRITEDRPAAFRHDLRDLLADVTDEQVTVDDSGLTLSAAASRALGVGRIETEL
ncbi:hypothetical protein ACERIT_03770 [Halopenitus sp. H-Gu1]|uniref:hypothetical protein n=1 Tax=Halopenitus sp. H-Gu1 TaxID=3242697 RepID=UPI00359EE257